MMGLDQSLELQIKSLRSVFVQGHSLVVQVEKIFQIFKV